MNFPVDDWEEIPLSTLKAMFEEVKEGFKATTEEVISCTDKSIKCLFGFFTFVFGVGLFILSNRYPINWYCYITLIAFCIYNAFIGYKVIRKRPAHAIGLLPENVLSKDYNKDSDFNEIEKEKLFYYKAILVYTQKIKEGNIDNGKRAKKYDEFFGLTLLLIMVTTIFVFYTISNLPLSVKS